VQEVTVGTPIQVVMDCADPARLSAFWAVALGYELQAPPEGFDSWEAFLASIGVPESEWNSRSAVVDPAAEGPRLFFQRVPEAKTVKNRVHVDVNAGGGLEVADEERRARVAAKVDQLVTIGASVFKDFEQSGEHWVVMQDPEGNEFCVQ
jgi:catechol 2,3-dioxygenase-like lactoylglutathione lyase family enzyme